MAAAAGNREAVKQHFNASTDRTITLDGIAHIVADALGTKADIVHYNEKEFDIPKGKGFPFRSVHFFASTDKAKALLGWQPKHDFRDDIREQVRPEIDKEQCFGTDDDLAVLSCALRLLNATHAHGVLRMQRHKCCQVHADVSSAT